MMHRILVALAIVGMGLVSGPVAMGQAALKASAAESLHRATEFFRTKIATEGGYLWRYSEDLTLREGEGDATAATIWVQPPGTPSVGMVYLTAYEATGDRYYLDAARDAAYALVKGQLRSGGWDYRVEFDPKQRRRYAYRTEPAAEGLRNVSTLDDNTTQSAIRLLMQVDKTLDFKDQKIHETALSALSSLLEVQYPNGAWPQRFSEPPDPAQFPVKKAGYPDSWSWTFPGKDYKSYYTFNDNSMADTIATMLEASEVYGDARYKAAAEKAGNFMLLAQMPDPQPAWAQQYDAEMHPAWARKFEPPAVTGGESQGVMRSLMVLYRATGNKKYLEPLPRAMEYLRRSRLPDGKLARFYELKTNKPLYFTKDSYNLTYSDANMPTHYSFKGSFNIDSIAREYEQLVAMDPAKLKESKKSSTPRLSRDLEAKAKQAIDSLDAQGRWVEKGRMQFAGKDTSTRPVITTRTFISNVRTLSDYLAATR